MASLKGGQTRAPSSQVADAVQQLGHRITISRRARNMTQADLAAAAGVGLSTVRQLEAGGEGVAIGNLAKVLLGLSLLEHLDAVAEPARDPAVVSFAVQTLSERRR